MFLGEKCYVLLVDPRVAAVLVIWWSRFGMRLYCTVAVVVIRLEVVVVVEGVIVTRTMNLGHLMWMQS